jgi:hypothetical protein
LAEWQLPNLRVDAAGEWYADDVQVTHPGILANLRANLRRDADGYFVQTRVRIPVRVADVPWVVTRLERRGDTLTVWLNDDTVETIDPASLRLGTANVPYCTVKDGAFEARLSRAATFQLWALADYDEASGHGALRLGAREYPLGRAP